MNRPKRPGYSRRLAEDSIFSVPCRGPRRANPEKERARRHLCLVDYFVFRPH